MQEKLDNIYFLTFSLNWAYQEIWNDLEKCTTELKLEVDWLKNLQSISKCFLTWNSKTWIAPNVNSELWHM